MFGPHPESGTQSSAATMLTAIADVEAGLLRYWKSARSSDFIRKVSETYATRMVLIGVSLVTTVVVARLLGPEGRGLYAIAAATGALGVQFGNLGLHSANVFFAARNRDSMASLVGNSVMVSLGFGSLLAAVLAAAFAIAPDLISVHSRLLLLALVWIPLGL